MKRLSRDNIEIIANRVFKAYKALPDIKNSECYRIEPEKLILEVLGLSIGIEYYRFPVILLVSLLFVKWELKYMMKQTNLSYTFLTGKRF